MFLNLIQYGFLRLCWWTCCTQSLHYQQLSGDWLLEVAENEKLCFASTTQNLLLTTDFIPLVNTYYFINLGLSQVNASEKVFH
jgi:hypothetical protein